MLYTIRTGQQNHWLCLLKMYIKIIIHMQDSFRTLTSAQYDFHDLCVIYQQRLWIHQCLKLHFLGQNIVKTEAEQPTNPIGWNLNELHRHCYLKSQVHSLTFKKWLLRPVWQCRATDTSVAHTARHLAGRRAPGLKYDGLCSGHWQGGPPPGVCAHPTPSCSTTGSP